MASIPSSVIACVSVVMLFIIRNCCRTLGQTDPHEAYKYTGVFRPQRKLRTTPYARLPHTNPNIPI